MSPAMAVCASCGHILSERDALAPCSKCGGTERTLRRDALVVEQPDEGTPEEQLQVEERRPDGSCEVVRDPLDIRRA